MKQLTKNQPTHTHLPDESETNPFSNSNPIVNRILSRNESSAIKNPSPFVWYLIFAKAARRMPTAAVTVAVSLAATADTAAAVLAVDAPPQHNTGLATHWGQERFLCFYYFCFTIITL